MDETWLSYVMTEKKFGVDAALKALIFVKEAKGVLPDAAYDQLYQLFYRTWLTARIYEATATSYFGYRVYARGASWQSGWLKKKLNNSLDSMLKVASEIENYKADVPVGQWKWRNDAKTAREYHKLITETGWEDYRKVVFKKEW